MHSWLVWLVFLVACVVLGFVGYHFSVRTLRFVVALFALAVVVVVTRYGVAHPGAGPHPDLVNSFAQGFDALSRAFLGPLLGHRNNPIPGRIGWLVIIGLLVFGYREVEVWAMRWQPPTVDLSALGGDQEGPQSGSASGGQGKAATDQRHNDVANELRFRLPAVAVKAPAILPGGARVAGLVSIAESTGNTAGGLAGAIIDFVGTLWPNPRRYRVRIRVEPPGDKRRSAAGVKVTVDLEDSRSGGSIATKTLAARQLDEAACMVAGYVARQIFSRDPTAPPWCYGKSDGSDLAALLSAWQDRVYPNSPGDIPEARNRQMGILERGASSSVCAGVTRYELAQLHDIDGYHVEALRLHALNREQYPRFFRGRYRLGMSLEMIANPEFELDAKEAKETLRECLKILDRCGVTHDYKGRDDDIERIKRGKPLPRLLRMELLTAAQDELCTVRRQLTLWRIIWAAFVHRDERAILKQYRRMAERERFHDGARVAELLVAVRKSLNEEEECARAERGSSQGQPAATHDGQSAAKQDQHEDRDYRKFGYYSKRVMNVYDGVMKRYNLLRAEYNLARAEWITAAIIGEKDTIKAVLKPGDKSSAAEPKSAATRDGQSAAKQDQHEDRDYRKVSYYSKRVMNRYNLAKARRRMARMIGEKETIIAALKPENKSKPPEPKTLAAEDAQPRRYTQRTRWVPWQHSTPSWQAAYNTACLYAALAGKYGEKEMAEQVVTSLTRAVKDPHCEMGQPTDWIGKDPDFNSVRQSFSFTTFFIDQWERDHQRVNPVPAHH